MCVEFTDLDAPYWVGLYHFILTLEGKKCLGYVQVVAHGKVVADIDVAIDRPLRQEKHEEIGRFVSEQFEKVQKVSGIIRAERQE